MGFCSKTIKNYSLVEDDKLLVNYKPVERDKLTENDKLTNNELVTGIQNESEWNA